MANSEKTNGNEQFLIVGIGASAGGIQLVAEAKDNLEALDLAQYHLPDLILSEEEVPGFASLIRSVNEDSATRNLPIVIVNPDADEGARVGEAFVVNAYDRIARLLTGPRE